MDTLTAHGKLAQRDDLDDLLPGDFSREGCDYKPAFATALARLSGGLEDVQTDDELADAVRHGLSLINAEVIAPDNLAEEANAVVEEIRDWGAWIDGQISRMAEAN
jgi:hypothetical protein